MTADLYSASSDRYLNSFYGDWPPRRSFALTPSDTLDVTNASGANMPVYARSVYVGVSGDVSVVTAGDQSAAGVPVVYKAHPVGYMPVQVRRVMATGTTATNLVGMCD